MLRESEQLQVPFLCPGSKVREGAPEREPPREVHVKISLNLNHEKVNQQKYQRILMRKHMFSSYVLIHLHSVTLFKFLMQSNVQTITFYKHFNLTLFIYSF